MIIADEVRRMLSEYGVEAEDTSLLSDLGLDSLDVIQLSVQFDSAFNVTIDVKKLDKVKTVADLISLVQAHVRLRGHELYCDQVYYGTAGENDKPPCCCGFSDVFWKDPAFLETEKWLK